MTATQIAESIQVVSIALEALIAIIALVGAIKGRHYLFGLTLTFGIYVYYDLARLFEWGTNEAYLTSLFFIATLSALISVWFVYKKK